MLRIKPKLPATTGAAPTVATTKAPDAADDQIDEDILEESNDGQPDPARPD